MRKSVNYLAISFKMWLKSLEFLIKMRRAKQILLEASARKISARISTESIKESVWLSFSQYGSFKRHIRASTVFKLSKI